MGWMGWGQFATHPKLDVQSTWPTHDPLQQVVHAMKGLAKGKKKPLGLPSTLQQELGLGLGGGGGSGGGMLHGKRRKGGAPLSRKEVGGPICVWFMDRLIDGLIDRGG